MGIIFKQSLKNTLIIYLGFFIGGINTLVLYIRFLKEEYYGLVSYILSSSNLVMPLIALGTHFTIIKFFSSYQTKTEKDKFLVSLLFQPLLMAVIIGYFWNYFHHWIIYYVTKENAVVENYTIYIYIIAVSCAYFEVFYSWAKVQMQTVFGNTLKELYNRVAVMLLLVAVYFNFIGKQQFISYLSYAYIFRTLIMMLYAFKLYFPKLHFSLPGNFVEVIKYTLYIILAGSASAIVLDIDKFMIPGKDTLSTAAYYTVAVFIGSFIEAPSRAMNQILQPLTSKSINENNSAELVNLYKKSSINLLLIGGLFFLLVNCSIVELFKMMPQGYAKGQWVVLMISTVKLFIMLQGNNSSIISNSAYYKIILFTSVGIAALVWSLNKYFYYTLNFGTEGLAFSTLIAYLLFGWFKIWYVQARLKMFPFTKQTLKLILLIVVFFAVFNYWSFNFKPFIVLGFDISPAIGIALKSILIIFPYIYLVYKLKISEQINSLVSKVLIKF
ncbi:MAG: lipopolysaccharide biosynthesis protein [Tenacibaculum sp.]